MVQHQENTHRIWNTFPHDTKKKADSPRGGENGQKTLKGTSQKRASERLMPKCKDDSDWNSPTLLVGVRNLVQLH